jgi:hypothetical protein
MPSPLLSGLKRMPLEILLPGFCPAIPFHRRQIENSSSRMFDRPKFINASILATDAAAGCPRLLQQPPPQPVSATHELSGTACSTVNVGNLSNE